MKKPEPIIADNAPDAKNIQAVCRDCSFAAYDEHDTQTGCKLNKIEKFRERGCTVTSAYDETGKEFFIIEDRFCVFWRIQGWEEDERFQIPKDKRSDSQLAVRVRHDVTTKFFTIIYIDKNHSLSDLKKTANSIKSGLVRPVHTIFCNNHSKIDMKDIIKVAKNSGTTWGVERLAEKDATKQRCVDICIKKAKSKDHIFYSFFQSGYKVPKNFHSDIDNALNDELITFLAIYPEGDYNEGELPDGFVGQVHIHKQIGGNSSNKSFLDKMKNVTESQKCPNLVKPLSEIVHLP